MQLAEVTHGIKLTVPEKMLSSSSKLVSETFCLSLPLWHE